jgi:hypothetical protein
VGTCPSCCDVCGRTCLQPTTSTTTLPGACGESAPSCGGAVPGRRDVRALMTTSSSWQFACRCFPTGVTPCMQSAVGFSAAEAPASAARCGQAISVSGDVSLSGCFCVSPTSTCGPFPGAV